MCQNIVLVFSRLRQIFCIHYIKAPLNSVSDNRFQHSSASFPLFPNFLIPSSMFSCVIIIWAWGFGMVGCWAICSIVFRISIGMSRLQLVPFVCCDCLCVSFFLCLWVNIQMCCVRFPHCINIIYCHICFVWWFVFNGHIIIGNFFFLVILSMCCFICLTMFCCCIIPVFASVSFCSVLYFIQYFVGFPSLLWCSLHFFVLFHYFLLVDWCRIFGSIPLLKFLHCWLLPLCCLHHLWCCNLGR